MSAAQSNNQPPSTWTEPPWSGWIETTGDALLILEAARRGLIPRVTRRLVDSERKMITSGSVFVFDEDESGIKRWTDGFFWSPSRILGNFLLYRETDKRGAGHRGGRSDASASDVTEQYGNSDNGKTEGSLSRPRTDDSHLGGVDRQRQRTLMGSLTNSYKFKSDGLMKKTFSLTIGGVSQHLISYYRIEDVQNGRLRSPSSLPELASLDISPEYLDKTHFRNPPKVEIGVDGIPRYRGEADDIDSSPSLLTAPLSSGLPLLTDSHLADSGTSRRGERFKPYACAPVRRPRRSTRSSTGEPTTPTEQQQQQASIPQPGTHTNGYPEPNVVLAPPPPHYPPPYSTVPNYYPVPGYPTMPAHPPHVYYSTAGNATPQHTSPVPPTQYQYTYPAPAPPTAATNGTVAQQASQPVQEQAQQRPQSVPASYYPYPLQQPHTMPYNGAWTPYPYPGHPHQVQHPHNHPQSSIANAPAHAVIVPSADGAGG